MEYKIKKLKLKLYLTVLRVLGYKFEEAKDEVNLKKVKYLRYIIYKGEGYIKEKNCPDGLTDKYEPHSTSFIAKYKNQPIGTARIVFDSEEGFPTENLFPIEKLNKRTEVVEISRLAIITEFRNSKKRNRNALRGLGIKMFLYSREKGIKRWVTNMPEKLANNFKKNFKLNVIKLNEGELTEKNEVERKIIEGYFKRFKLLPYVINIE